MYQANQQYPIKSFKDKIKEDSRKMSLLHAFYLPTIFTMIASLYISFAFLAWDFWWYTSGDAPLELFFDNLFNSLGITMSVFTIPIIAGCVLRILVMLSFSSSIQELGKTYPFVNAKAKKASSYLKLGVVVEIVTIFAFPLVGNLGGAVVVLYSYYILHDVFADLKSKGLYEGGTNKSLFNSYFSMIVIFPTVAILSLIIMAYTDYSGIHNYVLAVLPIAVLLIGTIWHIIAFFNFAKNMHKLKDPSPEAVVAAQQPRVPQGYVPYAPQAQYVPPPQQAQHIQQAPTSVEEQSDVAFCINCGTKIGASVKFCPTCGTAR